MNQQAYPAAYRMVKEQIEARGVKDTRVLEAMSTVPRDVFVPEKMKPLAYEDRPLSIGHEQTISQPYIVARMLELCSISPEDRVLEVGAGSGYVAALLGRLAEEVISVERIAELATRASTAVRGLGLTNVRVLHSDGYKGYPPRAPYDAIVLSAAPPKIPDQLYNQLAEGGRMVAPEGGRDQQLFLIRKRQGKVERAGGEFVRFVPMREGTQE